MARAIGAHFMRADAAAVALGMRLIDAGPGRASLALTVDARHLNGHGICHGGVIFTLADTAFAIACNSRNRKSVAAGCNIEFLSPGQPGETLTATASERVVAGRAGIYDISVRGAGQRPVAELRGKSRSLGDLPVLDAAAPRQPPMEQA